MKFYFLISIFLLGLISITTGCKKLVEIPPPVGTITTSQVFSTDKQAISASTGMYQNMINALYGYSSDEITFTCGMSADELIPFNQNSGSSYEQFFQNNVSPRNLLSGSFLWANAYSTTYQANAILDGLQNYSGVHDSLKNELTGEAEFVRAFDGFYLVNIYGDIPLPTSINWRKTNLLSRTPMATVYESIIADLTDAQKRLPSDFSAGKGQRIIPNKWAATALLARTYLYIKNWKDAEIQASAVINNTNLFRLDSLNGVFLTNSSEAIWQLQQDNSGQGNTFNATPEGYLFIPFDSNTAPFAYITKSFMNSYEKGDQRRNSWIDSTIYNNIKYYFPYKYKVGPAQASPGGPYSEYYMVLRLAEQYLIRAEAEANGAGSGLSGAINDLNIIRNRAGLPNYTGSSSDKNAVLTAIYNENQHEFFAEWGHRWFDLIRWGIATQVLPSDKKSVISKNSLLYPIPQSELQTDPNLTQNPGY